MFKWLSRVLRDRPHPFATYWEWAAHHGPKRWRTLVRWTHKRAESARKRHLWKKARWWAAKRTVYRRKLRKARERAKTKTPKWESWMANGCDDRVNEGVKAFVARAVVTYDCVATSLARTFVPPGGSTTSYHLLSVNNPARAGDIAGARMAEFQSAEYKRDVGNSNCLELLGPINDKWVKNGAHTSGGEGTALEQLHDSHCHGAFAR